jgi:hypothetical protein
MDPDAALAKLTEISKQIEAAVVFEDGTPLASTLDAARAARMAELSAQMLALADELEGEAPVTQVEAATGEGSVFLVREDETAIAATTGTGPVTGLVMYDLRTCLRALMPVREPA